MRRQLSLSIPAVLATALVSLVLLVNPLATTHCLADVGVLKLKVWGCAEEKWLSNALVEVVIYRPGVGQVDSETGYTDGTGYVQFSFGSLQSGDEARTTVTPSERTPDTSHRYTWQGMVGDWDIVSYDSPCSDEWFDPSNHVIQCVYN